MLDAPVTAADHHHQSQPDDDFCGGTQPPTAADLEEEELLQLTLAPMQELNLGGGAAGAGGGMVSAGRASQPLSGSQVTAGAIDAVRAHVMARVDKAGRVDKMDVAAKFCTVR